MFSFEDCVKGSDRQYSISGIRGTCQMKLRGQRDLRNVEILYLLPFQEENWHHSPNNNTPGSGPCLFLVGNRFHFPFNIAWVVSICTLHVSAVFCFKIEKCQLPQIYNRPGLLKALCLLNVVTSVEEPSPLHTRKQRKSYLQKAGNFLLRLP